MNILHFINEIIYLYVPFLYPFWCVFFCWLIWLVFKWRNWSRPSVSILLLFSTSIGITNIKSWQGFRACLNNPSCDPDLSLPFVLFPFLGEVAFWLIILYVPIVLELKPVKLFEQKRKWRIVFIVVLAIALLLSEESITEFRFLPFVIRELTYFDLITKDIYFYPFMGMLIPWFIWLLLGMFERPQPALPTMLIYSISASNVSIRLWVQESVCNFIYRSCDVNFSLPLFIGEIALWFIPLYALIKLIIRKEISRHDHAAIVGSE